LKLLDLFCCCGGISKGFHNKGWDCTGVDITNNHQYPYAFIHDDVFNLPVDYFQEFDLIHASPPCQVYTWGTRKDRKTKFVDLVDKTRQLLLKTGKPFIIENVIGAPLRKDLILCGEMFKLRVLRHRIFEIEGFTVLQPKHEKHKPPVNKTHSYYSCVSGHGGDSYSFKLEDWQRDIGIDWVNNKAHLTQMIPPKYAEYIASNY
jgi:Site-specific DNA methylase